MTAEIAILNRTAVALAADSVVTLSTGQRGRKTYDSAEKIFQLSRYQPIGLMIYNNAQFMNAPLEVLARRYRETLTAKAFKHLEDVWPAFSTYLRGFSHTDADEDDHLRQWAAVEINDFRAIHVNHMLGALTGSGKRPSESAEQRVARAVAERRKQADAAQVSGFLATVTEKEFLKRHRAVIDEVADVALSGLDLERGIRAELHGLMLALVRSDIRTGAFTGFVFAGFGDEDLFPTLTWVEVDGMYFGEFRIVGNGVHDIDRRGETAAIVPFAQTDMPERFMFGIDHVFEAALERLTASIVGQILDSKPRAFPPATRAALKEAALDRFREGLGKLKSGSEQTLRSVVDHLSKKELAEVAYSLVELTSRKRRYSNELETVGGPIDVAILTRNEGFVWVKRKHYFDADLNPDYFKRQR